MLKKLTIRNFKAITDMTIEFNKIAVLIGGNSSGKSTILQILDFLRGAIAYNDIKKYFDDNDSYFYDCKSKNIEHNNEPIEIITEFEFFVDGSLNRIEWSFSVDEKGEDFIIHEKVENLNNKMVYCSYNYNGIDNKPEILKQIKLKSSAINFLNSLFEYPIELLPLLCFVESISNFALLSLDKIRNSGKEFPFNTPGNSGEYLFSFINKMTSEQKSKLNMYLSDFLDHKIKVETEKLHNGQIGLWIDETYPKSKNASIHSSLISDGLLRLIALVSIIIFEFPKQDICKPAYGLILLDEIENGINPYLVEKTVNLIKHISQEKDRQVILTTHSPVFLNDFDPNDIVFLWRDKNGSAHARKFFDTEEMREALGFLNPGEIWENYGKDTILAKLAVKDEDR